MSAAVECIRDVFPQSAVKTIRVDKFPLRITISTDAFEKPQDVWSGKQANLYEKYPKRRRKCMDLIKMRLSDLKDTLSSCKADCDSSEPREIETALAAEPANTSKAVLVGAV
mmetsp:Transcript_2630/g.3745  ORF Transcript_2630/g.3745 Transcript_2630/m.3745 type:complete len:112 (+) Transcript_2630:149-484(+)